jgi:hypothetical protein
MAVGERKGKRRKRTGRDMDGEKIRLVLPLSRSDQGTHHTYESGDVNHRIPRGMLTL